MIVGGGKAKKKVVALKFDDGSDQKIDGVIGLMRYIEAVNLEEIRDQLFRGMSLGELEANIKAIQQVHAEEESETKSANASKPRNRVTKIELIAFMEQFERDKGTKHGAQAAACRKFLIDPGTLKKRIAD